MNQLSLDLHDLIIRREDLLSAIAAKLINALNQELTERYPEDGANHFSLDADEVEEGRGAFFIAFIRLEPLGCGAVRLIDPATAEIKRMYVAPQARGLGLGRQILMKLENAFLGLGYFSRANNSQSLSVY
jgi:putative acetyltransferase